MTTKLREFKHSLKEWLDANHLRGGAKFYSKTAWDEHEGRRCNVPLTLVIEESPLHNILNFYSPDGGVSARLTKFCMERGYYWELGYSWSLHFYHKNEEN